MQSLNSEERTQIFFQMLMSKPSEADKEEICKTHLDSSATQAKRSAFPSTAPLPESPSAQPTSSCSRHSRLFIIGSPTHNQTWKDKCLRKAFSIFGGTVTSLETFSLSWLLLLFKTCREERINAASVTNPLSHSFSSLPNLLALYTKISHSRLIRQLFILWFMYIYIHVLYYYNIAYLTNIWLCFSCKCLWINFPICKGNNATYKRI